MVCGRKALFSVLLCCVYGTVVEKRDITEYLIERVRDLDLDDDFCTTLEGVEELNKELGLLAEGKYLEMVEEQMVERALAKEPSPMEIAMLLTQLHISLKAETEDAEDAEQVGPKEIKNFEEFVSKAKEEPAKENILKYLPLAHGWEKPHDFHRFLVSIYPSYYDKEVWESIYEFDWGDILWAACEADNVALAIKIREKKAQAQYDMITFDSELISACIEYDAINVFQKMIADPSLLEPHFKSMVAKSSGRLLQLYQAHIKSENLHLKELPFSKKPAASVESFKVLMDNGQNEFPMSQHITSLCNWERLDILEYLRKSNPLLVPTNKDLKLAAEKGQKNILEWAFKSKIIDSRLLNDLVGILAIHHHFPILVSLSAMRVRDFTNARWLAVIPLIVEAGNLVALEWIVENRCNIENYDQKWIKIAVKKGHYQVFKYLYEKAIKKLEIQWLNSFTVKQAEKRASLSDSQHVGSHLITKELVRDGANNFEFLRWVLKNRPDLLNYEEKKYLSREEHKKWLTEWLLTDKASLDYEELVKYVEGSLKLLEAVAMDKLGSSLLNDAEWDVLREEKLDAWLKKWENDRNPDLINEDLVDILTRNFELLHWVSSNMPGSLNGKEKECLSKKEHNGTVMKWIHGENDPRSWLVNDAYFRDDLPALKWAKYEWNMKDDPPTPESPDFDYVSFFNPFEIPEWLYENFPHLIKGSDLFKCAIRRGKLALAEKLIKSHSIDKYVIFNVGLCYMDAGRQLETLKWLKDHGFILNISYVILYVATKKRYSQNFEWLFNNYTEEIARNSHAWELAARCGHHNIYKLLLENYPNQHQEKNMLSDFCWAANNGHLKVVKLILDKLNQGSPFTEKLPEIKKVTSLNHHVSEYLRKLEGAK